MRGVILGVLAAVLIGLVTVDSLTKSDLEELREVIDRSMESDRVHLVREVGQVKHTIDYVAPDRIRVVADVSSTGAIGEDDEVVDGPLTTVTVGRTSWSESVRLTKSGYVRGFDRCRLDRDYPAREYVFEELDLLRSRIASVRRSREGFDVRLHYDRVKLPNARDIPATDTKARISVQQGRVVDVTYLNPPGSVRTTIRYGKASVEPPPKAQVVSTRRSCSDPVDYGPEELPDVAVPTS